MSRGPEMGPGGHWGSWSCASPYLDGTWTFRLCQPQMAISAAVLRLSYFYEVQPSKQHSNLSYIGC